MAKKELKKSAVAANQEKTNLKFETVYNVLHDTMANKNVLTAALNSIGIAANMSTKNKTDFITLTPNDYYFQFIDGSRIFINPARTKFAIYTNNTLLNSGFFDGIAELKQFSDSRDSGYRNVQTGKIFEFTPEIFNDLFSRFVDAFPMQLLSTASFQ